MYSLWILSFIMLTSSQKISLLKQAFHAGLSAVMPRHFMTDIVSQLQQTSEQQPISLIAFGKAAGEMARGYFEAGGRAVRTLVIVPDTVHCEFDYTHAGEVSIIYSAHPVPNEKSEEAAKAALSMAESLDQDDQLVVLISGGGSSLMSLGLGEVTLKEKQAINQALLDSGMPIQQVNIVRKHLSAVKGGRLALAAYPASIVSYVISDVPDDDPSAIASGPTYGDESTREMAAALLANAGIEVSDKVKQLLADARSESPFEDDARLQKCDFHIVASAPIALQAAARPLRDAGYDVVICEDSFQLDTVTLADVMQEKLAVLPMGTALISGGEASVEVKGSGIGGRNAQFALEMTRRQLPDICGISCDTDGIDGAKQTAGAVFYDGLVQQAIEQNIAIDAYYANFDSHTFFEKLGCDIVTGPTETNVNDLRILLKGSPVTPSCK